MYNLLKESRTETLCKSLNPTPQIYTSHPLVTLAKKAYQNQKRNYSDYLKGEQKFKKEFLLNTFFQIEANERNKTKKSSKKLLAEKQTIKEKKSNIGEALRLMKKKTIEEDLKALKSISESAVFQFSEKLTLYNNYSTTFLIEPTKPAITKQYMGLKNFRILNWKKTVPMSAYVRRIKTLYSEENAGSPGGRNEEDERKHNIKKNVVAAFARKQPEKSCFYFIFVTINIY